MQYRIFPCGYSPSSFVAVINGRWMEFSTEAEYREYCYSLYAAQQNMEEATA